MSEVVEESVTVPGQRAGEGDAVIAVMVGGLLYTSM
jgi:hypothetical protein